MGPFAAIGDALFASTVPAIMGGLAVWSVDIKEIQ